MGRIRTTRVRDEIAYPIAERPSPRFRNASIVNVTATAFTFISIIVSAVMYGPGEVPSFTSQNDPGNVRRRIAAWSSLQTGAAVRTVRVTGQY